MKISQLIEKLEKSKNMVGDVEVFIYDYDTSREYEVGGINIEADHIEITK